MNYLIKTFNGKLKEKHKYYFKKAYEKIKDFM